MMIVNGDARVVNKLEASLTDDARVIIYNRHMFIVQATGLTINYYYIVSLQCLGRDKHSSLFFWIFSDEEKSFMIFPPVIIVIKRSFLCH